jgi:zinc/manganese transport system ATP-binding protein
MNLHGTRGSSAESGVGAMPPPAAATAATRSIPAIVFDGAAVRVGGRLLWSKITLGISRGEFVAILGPNGVGKSTLVKAVLGLQPLAEGRVEVLGQRPGQANANIGYLPQRRSFDSSLRVRGIDIVWLGLTGSRWGVPLPFRDRFSRRAAAEAARVAEVIALVGATAYAHRPIGQISGGEQQRLLIAQALVRQPDLLILDEPLDSLDLLNQGAVAALIRRICQEHGVTVLLVAHDVNPILPYLDRVIYLAHGGAVAGTPDTVITSETLSRLYNIPIEVLRTSDGRLVVVGHPDATSVHADRHAHSEHVLLPIGSEGDR